MITPEQSKEIAKWLFLSLYPEETAWFSIVWGALEDQTPGHDDHNNKTHTPVLGVVGECDPVSLRMAEVISDLMHTFLLKGPAEGAALVHAFKRRAEESNGPLKRSAAKLARIAEAEMNRMAKGFGVSERTFLVTCLLDNEYSFREVKPLGIVEEVLKRRNVDIKIAETTDQATCHTARRPTCRIGQYRDYVRAFLALAFRNVNRSFTYDMVCATLKRKFGSGDDRDNIVHVWRNRTGQFLGEEALCERIFPRGEGREYRVNATGWSFIWVEDPAVRSTGTLLHGLDANELD